METILIKIRNIAKKHFFLLVILPIIAVIALFFFKFNLFNNLSQKQEVKSVYVSSHNVDEEYPAQLRQSNQRTDTSLDKN